LYVCVNVYIIVVMAVWNPVLFVSVLLQDCSVIVFGRASNVYRANQVLGQEDTARADEVDVGDSWRRRDICPGMQTAGSEGKLSWDGLPAGFVWDVYMLESSESSCLISSVAVSPEPRNRVIIDQLDDRKFGDDLSEPKCMTFSDT